MPDMNDYGTELGVEARRILREALQALELHRATALIGDTTWCLQTDRVRRLASVASAATVHEQRHALGCARCHSRMRAFQGARLATPERALDGALQAARSGAAAIPHRWLAYADQHGRALFDIFRREREFGESPTAIWFPTHTVAQEIEVARNEGASPEIAAYLVSTALGTVAAATHDVLSPWSREFDRAWPLFELLRETAREVSVAGAPARDAFVRGYVNLAVGAPTHLKAILIDGVDGIGIATGSSGAHLLASSIAAELRRADQSPSTMALLSLPAILQVPVDEPEDVDELLRPYLIVSRTASAQLRRTIGRDDSRDDLAALVDATLASLFDPLKSDEDAIRTLLQLRVLRRYLTEIVGNVRLLHPDASESILDAALNRLVAYARVPGSSRFLLMAAAQAFAADAMVYAGLLSALASEHDPEIQHAVIVALRHAYDRELSATRVARFEQAGGIWSFVEATANPLGAAARTLAQSARMDPSLARSFEWFNRRPEPSIDSEQVFLPVNR